VPPTASRSQTAEEIKLEIGSTHPLPQEEQAEICGRDLVTGLPKTIVLTSQEIRAALGETVQAIVDAIKATLDKIPEGCDYPRFTPLFGEDTTSRSPRLDPDPRAPTPRRGAADLRYTLQRRSSASWHRARLLRGKATTRHVAGDNGSAP
jgi:hypothetical protein